MIVVGQRCCVYANNAAAFAILYFFCIPCFFFCPLSPFSVYTNRARGMYFYGPFVRPSLARARALNFRVLSTRSTDFLTNARRPGYRFSLITRRGDARPRAGFAAKSPTRPWPVRIGRTPPPLHPSGQKTVLYTRYIRNVFISPPRHSPRVGRACSRES